MKEIIQDTQTIRPYRVDLDILKAISIIAVVFYHIGWLDTGYLGVDVFFAINGFLIVPSLVKQITSDTFNYPTFLLKRIMRLWPLVLLVSALSLIIHNINLSYVFQHDEKYLSRYRNCDYLFTFRSKSQLPNYVTENINCNAKVYGLGTKNYGECNGVIYKHRNSPNYFKQTVRINPNFYTINNRWKQEWGSENYIDFLELSTMPNGEIRVFTDENRFISQDCQHLTQDGARWYAKIIDWEKIFNE